MKKCKCLVINNGEILAKDIYDIKVIGDSGDVLLTINRNVNGEPIIRWIKPISIEEYEKIFGGK